MFEVTYEAASGEVDTITVATYCEALLKCKNVTAVGATYTNIRFID